MANESYQTLQGISQKAAQASRILARLFACFPEGDTSAEAQADRFRGYLIAIETFDVATLEVVAVKIMRGRATIDGERVNPKFMPTPPQLALLCEEHRHEVFVAAKPRLVSNNRAEIELTPEIIARRKAKLEALQRTLDETIAATKMEA